MTNTPNRNHSDTTLTIAAHDIADAMPHRAPRFLAAMHAAIDHRFDSTDNPRTLPLTDADRLFLTERIIDLKF